VNLYEKAFRDLGSGFVVAKYYYTSEDRKTHYNGIFTC